MENKKIWTGVAAGMLLGAGVAGTLMYYRKRQTTPDGVKVLKPFDVNRYMGKWYEICRMPMRYEKGLEQVTAEYSLNPDGSVKVVNSGYDWERGKWQSATGKAVFVGDPTEARLKVSFFGPFYAGYNVIAVDDNYQYALVFGRNLDYMWILSREPEIPEWVLQKYIEKAAAAGYDYYRLIWTEQGEF